jgi:hypothetical protein
MFTADAKSTTRRSLLAGAAAAAAPLAGAAVTLPTILATPAGAASADAELIARCERAMAAYEHIEGTSGWPDRALDDAVDQADEIVRSVFETRAQSAAGMRAKADLLLGVILIEKPLPDDLLAEQWAWSLAQDILALASPAGA